MNPAESGATVPFPERMPPFRGGTTAAAWQGVAASLLLHLVVGAAAIGALSSGRAVLPPLVMDLTLTEPAGENLPAPNGSGAARLLRADVPVAAPRPGGRETYPLPAPAVSLQTKAEPADATGTAPTHEPSDASGPPPRAERVPAGVMPTPRPGTAAGDGEPRRIAPFSPSSTSGASSGSPPGAAATARAATGEGGDKAAHGNPAGKPDAGASTGDFAGIRDAIQHAIAYPATARRMGWEGKVVVAFQLLPDGSVRDVRVVQGSGHGALDRGAIDAVRNASPFPRSPGGTEVITPVVYRLTTR